MFSREFGRPKTAKFKIYLSFEGAGASVVALSFGRWWCPLVQVVQGAGASGVLRCVFRPFALPLSLCRFCFPASAFKYGSISHFKGVLEGFYGADVCLCGFGVLR